MIAIASQITSLMIFYSTVYSDADERKHQSSASLAFVWGIHRWPVNSLHKWQVTRKMFPFDDVIMGYGNVMTGMKLGMDEQLHPIELHDFYFLSMLLSQFMFVRERQGRGLRKWNEWNPNFFILTHWGVMAHIYTELGCNWFSQRYVTSVPSHYLLLINCTRGNIFRDKISVIFWSKSE